MSEALLQPEDLLNYAQFEEAVNVYEGRHNQDCEMSLKTPHVAVYLRCSTMKQFRSGAIDSQKLAMERWLIGRGIDINECSIYIDGGVSALQKKRIDERPSGKELMNDVEAGLIKKLYAFSISRLFRNMAAGSAWLEHMTTNYNEVEIMTSDCPYDANISTGQQMWHMFMAFSMFENTALSEKTKVGMDRLQENLQKSSHAVFGWFYNEDEERMNPDWHQQAVISHVHKSWNDNKGQSFAQIARDLNKWNIKTATGKVWSHSSTRRLVKQPAKLHDQLHQFNEPKRMITAPFRGFKAQS